ncbi:MAG: hypothetical protein WAU28_05520 [Candidatus Moraniibacteriota bacterium]
MNTDFWIEFWPQFFASIASTLFLALITFLLTYLARLPLARFLKKTLKSAGYTVVSDEKK